MVGQDLSGQRNGILGGDGLIGIDLQRQLVIVGHVAHAGVFHHIIHLMNGSIDGIHGDQANDRLSGLVLLGRGIAAAVIESQLHVELSVLHQRDDVEFGVQYFDLAITADIAGSDFTGAHRLNGHGLFASAMQLGDDALNIQDDLRDILFHTGNGGKLVLHAINLDRSGGSAGQRGQQNAAQGVTEGSAITDFQRLYNKLAVRTVFQRFDTFNTGLFNCNHSLPSYVKVAA